MRRNLWLGLLACFVLCGAGPVRADNLKQSERDEQSLKAAHVKTDGASLLAFFGRRTLAENDRDKVAALIRQLGSKSYKEREQAAVQLIARGPVVVEMLKSAVKDNDLEVVRRAEKCLRRIQDTDYAVEVPAAAARLLALRKPAGAIETLLAFLPYADNDTVADEVRNVLVSLAVPDGKADKALVAALGDKAPFRRAAAAEALCRAHAHDYLPAIRKLLKDPEPSVCLRVSMALAFAGEKEAIAVLIDLLPALTLVQAWQAEDILYRLGEGHKPPAVSLGNDDITRKKCRDAWAAWWKEQHRQVDLAMLNKTPPLQGYTLLVLLDEGLVREVNAAKETRWQIDGLAYPLDAQMLPGDRVLLAEHRASRVTERDTKGNIKWEKRIVGPLAAQRLANGNTFIVTDSMLLEFDVMGKEVLSLTIPGERIMKAVKLPNGEIVCLTNDGTVVGADGKTRVVRLDGTGKVLHSFPVSLSMRLFGGRIHVLSNGHVLIPHNGEHKVVEYDGAGKEVWKVAIDQPITATRLSNGNTLVTSMLLNRGAVEFDRNGNMVWQYTSNSSRVTRALRR